MSETNESMVREAVEGADARQWAEEWWRCHAADYFKASMGAVPELVAYFTALTPSSMRHLLAELDEAREQAKSFAEQLLAERHDHERTKVSAHQHKQAAQYAFAVGKGAQDANDRVRALADDWTSRGPFEVVYETPGELAQVIRAALDGTDDRTAS